MLINTRIKVLFSYFVTAMNTTDSPSMPTNTTAVEYGYTTGEKIGLTIVYIIIFTLALFGNSIGLYVVCTKTPSRRITDLLIKNLAIADLIFALIIIPQAVVYMYYEPGLWFGGIMGHITCKVAFYAIPVSVAASVITLTVISFDRFCAIFHPLSQVFFHKHRAITALIWLVALIAMTPYLLLYRLFKQGDQYFCSQEWPWAKDVKETYIALRKFHVFIFVLLYALPLVIIAAVNSLIACRVWFHRSPGNTASVNRASAEVTRRKVVQMLLAIVVAFALCWLPTYVNHYFMYFKPAVWFEIPIVVRHLMFWVSHANSAINPLLYIAFNKNFRCRFLDATAALFASPFRAIGTCMAYIEEKSTPDPYHQHMHPARPKQHSGFRVAPSKPGGRNGTGRSHETKL